MLVALAQELKHAPLSLKDNSSYRPIRNSEVPTANRAPSSGRDRACLHPPYHPAVAVATVHRVQTMWTDTSVPGAIRSLQSADPKGSREAALQAGFQET